MKKKKKTYTEAVEEGWDLFKEEEYYIRKFRFGKIKCNCELIPRSWQTRL